MIDTEPGIPEHTERDGDERRQQHLARGADLVAQQHHHRQRDCEIIGIALLEAKRARLQAWDILEDPRAENGRRADRRDDDRRRCYRPGLNHADRHLAHAVARGCALRPATHITIGRRQWYGAVDPLHVADMIADEPLWRNW